jgi:hypothetical protein
LSLAATSKERKVRLTLLPGEPPTVHTHSAFPG